MPFGMGWLVDVRDLILENPLWMFVIFLLIVKYRLMMEKNIKGTEMQYQKEQFDDELDKSFEEEFEDNFDDNHKKWYQKLFKKKK